MEWEPIGNAPKDGSVVLLGNKEGTWVGRYVDQYESGFRPPNPWMSLMLNHRHISDLYTLFPTHWAPLPAPPKQD